MKYTFLINQAGIVDAGLAGSTDFNDWAILEYIAEWQVHGSATVIDGHVWINFRHLMQQMPLLSVQTKGALSRRLKKLADLGLISSFQSEGNLLYAKVTDFYSSIVFFRGEPGVSQDFDAEENDIESVAVGKQGVAVGKQGCCRRETHIINNHRINNQDYTKHNRGRARVEPVDSIDHQETQEKTELVHDVEDSTPTQPLQWAKFFINECQYPLHIVQTAKTIPMFADWVARGVTVGDMRQAMAACHAWNGERIPDSPMLYKKFLQTIYDERKRLADDAKFSERPGAGRIRAIDDWAKVPKLDDELWPWATKHGYPGPGTRTYRDYRSFLYAQVEKRVNSNGIDRFG